MEHHLILRVITKLLAPFTLLFAFYVQFHGDYGPGGGFQAGIIFASVFILYNLIFGVENATRVMPLSLLRALSALGLMLYVGVGFVTMLLGGNFLEYGVLAENVVAGQHIGIMLVELGVGLTVAGTATLIFLIFARP